MDLFGKSKVIPSWHKKAGKTGIMRHTKMNGPSDVIFKGWHHGLLRLVFIPMAKDATASWYRNPSVTTIITMVFYRHPNIIQLER